MNANKASSAIIGFISSDMDICATKMGMKPRRTPWKGGMTINNNVDHILTRGGFSSIVVSRTDVHKITEIKMVKKPAMKKMIKNTFSSNANQTINSM